MPTVTIDQPASNIFVTPQGEVVLRITAKDDLSLAQVGLHFNRSDRTDVEDFSVPLYDGPAEVEPLTGAGLLIGGKLGENRTLEHRWSLAELGLKAPVQVTFWATARDYLPQTGKSTTRRLSIITPQELEERLEQRQSLIFGELQRVLKLQQDARSDQIARHPARTGRPTDEAGYRPRAVGRAESTAGEAHAHQPLRRHSRANRGFSLRPGEQ